MKINKNKLFYTNITIISPLKRKKKKKRVKTLISNNNSNFIIIVCVFICQIKKQEH